MTIKPLGFNPKGIILDDDAVHEPKIFGNVETWYYDAIFDNNYSMACVVNFIQFLKIGVILTGLFIYKDTQLIRWVRDRTTTTYFNGSRERPYIIIGERKIIDGEIAQDSKKWTYHIAMGDEKNNVNLCFIKKMDGWKGNHFLGDWLAVPSLDVQGNIHIDGKEIPVTGHGYHDHNNYPLLTPFFNRGANFGKIAAGSINVVWAQVIRNKNKTENIVMINTAETFQSIQSKDIKLSVEEYVQEHRKIIPTKYLLQVETQDIDINVQIQSKNYHYITIPTVKYWRHHARNSGEIRFGTQLEKVNDISIIDQLSFL